MCVYIYMPAGSLAGSCFIVFFIFAGLRLVGQKIKKNEEIKKNTRNYKKIRARKRERYRERERKKKKERRRNREVQEKTLFFMGNKVSLC